MREEMLSEIMLLGEKFQDLAEKVASLQEQVRTLTEKKASQKREIIPPDISVWVHSLSTCRNSRIFYPFPSAHTI